MSKVTQKDLWEGLRKHGAEPRVNPERTLRGWQGVRVLTT